MDKTKESIQQIKEIDNFSMKHLTFKIAEQHYGVPISNVIEIVQIQPLTELPDMPFYTKGIINLRGQVVPLVDVNMRFGNPERKYTDRTCIIIADINSMNVGLIVDIVEEVLNIESGSISVPPSFSGNASTNYLKGIAKLEKYVVLMLDIHLMLPDTEWIVK